jgi:predicted enzyme related to lactoylglutathione lyase
VVFFLGSGFLEVSGHSEGSAGPSEGSAGPSEGSAGPSEGSAGQSVMLWLQVRDITAEHERLVGAGVPVVREPVAEPWGLTEMWIEDPDGVLIVLVEVPADHPLRRDLRL